MKINLETQNVIDAVLSYRNHTLDEVKSNHPHPDYRHTIDLLCYFLWHSGTMKQSGIASTLGLYGASSVCEKNRKIEYLLKIENRHAKMEIEKISALIEKQFIDAN